MEDKNNDDDFNRILEFSDDIEKRVEEYRSTAKRLIQDRKGLEDTLGILEDSLSDLSLSKIDSDEIKANVNRLRSRVQTVRVEVLNNRDPLQAEAHMKVDMKIAELISGIESEKEPLDGVRERLKLYLNACSEGTGTHDFVFEKLVLSCSSEDQKNIKSRLEDLSKCVNVLASSSITKAAAEDIKTSAAKEQRNDPD